MYISALRKMWCILVFCTLAALASPAQTFTRLFSFDSTNGFDPTYMSLVQGTDGNFYGTTQGGGANGGGTVFKITSGGALTTIYNFCAEANCADGSSPNSALVQGTDGSFYGTTIDGGVYGYGSVFKITSTGTLTTLYSFCAKSSCEDGFGPHAGLIQGTSGAFYGTTEEGGVNGDYGTVFEITSKGALTTLHSFEKTDGYAPLGGLVQGTNGIFYGTTYIGGANSLGTVFQITAAGTFKSLHSFDTTDGANPYDRLVQGTNGNLYGTTYNGGLSGYGTAFKITASGTLTTLHNFAGYPNEGAYPGAGLVLGSDGNFYGTTLAGGPESCGTVFEVTPAGALTTLYSFTGLDGDIPYGGLMQATNGTLYGSTGLGGASNDGEIFSLSVGLGPFVGMRPGSGKVGAKITILGTDLTGATSVTFNGIAATFTGTSSSEIKATVPVGATTGTIKVVTPGSGILKSNVPFRVTP